ncbi:FAD-binding domain-containing protein [Bacillus sp. MMSF_3328]|uniref:FAD-binding domain-containing protein n=1 Tax=Bacillus sp. MMSF_3328 TaxID=3047080 RepID=UPI00273D6A4F|nr:FAD-binding domain-containing protein [Bacillus sp. MMSF_3328]
MNIVWFRKDLRIHDHRPLAEACASAEEVIPLYIAEPLSGRKEVSRRHIQFAAEGLEQLDEGLRGLGGRLFAAQGTIIDILEELLKRYGDFSLFFHLEYDTDTDRQAAEWMVSKGLPFYPFHPPGQLEKPKSKSRFRKLWQESMLEELTDPPAAVRVPEKVPDFLNLSVQKALGMKVKGEAIRFGQNGGEKRGIETLEFFIGEQLANYEKNYQKPLASSFSSSRLSPYLAYGNISPRLAYHEAAKKAENCTETEKQQLSLFQSKLLERSEALQWQEKETQANAADSNSARAHDAELLEKWRTGNTGIPSVDASMRCLRKTGWLNYSSRRMLAGFACNILLLDWEKAALELALLFLDHEPAVHMKEMGILAGKSGSKTVKIIDPVKWGKELDTDGSFIRRYVPELKDVDAAYIHEPWLYPGFFQLGYPAPICDVRKAIKQAKRQIEDQKKDQKPKDILKSKKAALESEEQLTWDFD